MGLFYIQLRRVLTQLRQVQWALRISCDMELFRTRRKSNFAQNKQKEEKCTSSKMCYAGLNKIVLDQDRRQIIQSDVESFGTFVQPLFLTTLISFSIWYSNEKWMLCNTRMLLKGNKNLVFFATISLNIFFNHLFTSHILNRYNTFSTENSKKCNPNIVVSC